MSSTLYVPSIIVDTLYAEFKREARALCKDLAPVLGVPEKELRRILVDAVQQTELNVVNVDDLKKQCPVPVIRGSTAGVVELCRSTCILGTSRCAEHKEIQDYQIPIVETEKHLLRINTPSPSLPTLWLDQESGTVYNPQLQHIGIYKDDSLILFEFKECEE
jgi:hypothetical protein